MSRKLFFTIGLCAAVGLVAPPSVRAGIVEVPAEPEPEPEPEPELDPIVEEFLDELPALAPDEYEEVLLEQELVIICVHADYLE